MGAGRVDLDAAQRIGERWKAAQSEVAGIDPTMLLALVAELRVAREVAEADRRLMGSATPERIMRLNRARAAYRRWCDAHPPPTHDQAGAS